MAELKSLVVRAETFVPVVNELVEQLEPLIQAIWNSSSQARRMALCVALKRLTEGAHGQLNMDAESKAAFGAFVQHIESCTACSTDPSEVANHARH